MHRMCHCTFPTAFIQPWMQLLRNCAVIQDWNTLMSMLSVYLKHILQKNHQQHKVIQLFTFNKCDKTYCDLDTNIKCLSLHDFTKKIHLKYNWYIVRFIYFIEVSCSFWVCSRNNSIMSVLFISVKFGLHHNQMVESLKREDNTTSFPILSLSLSFSLSFSLSLRRPLPVFLRTAAICAVSQWHPDISHLKSCHSSQTQTSVREWVRAREMQPRRASAQLVLYWWKSGGVS